MTAVGKIDILSLGEFQLDQNIIKEAINNFS
jgi:hypothetical protein